MLNTSAIISEYNPFHNGHKYHVEKTRELGATHMIAIMGGNFSQRGTPSIVSKWAKTEMALSNGIDLVLELPTLWTVATAERFAFGAVSVADALGCVDSISFGSEEGNIENLKQAARAVLSDEINLPIKQNLTKGLSYAAARENAVAQIFGEDISKLLSSPNNILAVEYIKSLLLLNSSIIPMTIQRKGIGHDDDMVYNNIASASYIRKSIIGNEDVINIVPESVLNILKQQNKLGFAPVDIRLLERAVLSKLRTMSIDEISNVPDVSEGLENRIYEAIRKSKSLEELYDNIKTKRYTHARIRRIVLSAFLDIKGSDTSLRMPYIRVLGFNEKGREILKQAKETAKLPIIMKYSQIYSLDRGAKRVFDIECRSTDLYALCSPKVRNCGLEMTENQIIL